MSRPNPLPVPKSAADDARQRAVRSYLGGLIVAVLGSAVPILEAAAGDLQWSRAWWIALGITVASPALHAAAAYVLRHLAPPA
jgi:hypothetical protein